MSVAAERTSRVRISDPRPSHCAACFRGAEDGVKFVDFDAAIDRGSFADPDTLAPIGSIDDLHLCESCVREAAECLALRPQVSANQLREIRRLEKQLDALRGYVIDLEATISKRPSDVLRKGKA